MKEVLRLGFVLFFSLPIMKFGVLDRSGERKGQRPGQEFAVQDMHGVEVFGSCLGGLAAGQEGNPGHCCRDGA